MIRRWTLSLQANDGILNSLLTAINERRFTNEGQTVDIPAVSFFSASNEIPNFNNPEEKILRPLYDRFELKLVTEYVESRDNRLNVLKRKQSGTDGLITATFTLDELYAMQSEVSAVIVPDAVNELMDDLLCALRDKGIHISDRKYFGYYPLAQAIAWLDGRDNVTPSDLLILKHYLWTTPDERTVINSVLEQMCNDPLGDRLNGVSELALECVREFENSEGTDVTRRIGKLRNELVRVYEDALALRKPDYGEREKNRIDSLISQLEDYNKRAYDVVGRDCISLSDAYDVIAARQGA